MATLRIVRDSGYADRIRAYAVVIDSKRVGEIRNGEVKDFPISAGEHNLCLKIDWCGSNTVHFAASEEDVITFSAQSNLRGSRLAGGLWCALFAWNSWITLTQLDNLISR